MAEDGEQRAMIGEEGRDTVGQTGSEELKHDGRPCRVVRGKVLGMPPRGRGGGCVAQAIEVAVVHLISPEIRHGTLVWTCSHDRLLLAKSSSLHFLLKQAAKQA